MFINSIYLYWFDWFIIILVDLFTFLLNYYYFYSFICYICGCICPPERILSASCEMLKESHQVMITRMNSFLHRELLSFSIEAFSALNSLMERWPPPPPPPPSPPSPPTLPPPDEYSRAVEYSNEVGVSRDDVTTHRTTNRSDLLNISYPLRCVFMYPRNNDDISQKSRTADWDSRCNLQLIHPPSWPLHSRPQFRFLLDESSERYDSNRWEIHPTLNSSGSLNRRY